jgi:hypothetical protein
MALLSLVIWIQLDKKYITAADILPAHHCIGIFNKAIELCLVKICCILQIMKSL